jgi:hypothetical protein
VAINSAIGKEIQTPVEPKKIGRTKTKGIKKNPCLVKVRSNAGNASPID